ncbi:tetratricopeptide repeat protein [Luteolibacter luteus]|uniref:Sel1 repeat family protein n=1 Tax=Luteolibacter luteus TaxID=2728835 RepID=A0A858RMD5_9BACT|nr:tetratricopeptide repeat protein [Luteolibacter luteus]QJE97982.1 sel1 repeat family protein [Luteolibacter luteus]
MALLKTPQDNPAYAATEAYRNGWLSRTVELATPLADQGNAEALFLLGLAKEEVAPAKLSRRQAMDFCYRRAAAAGHPEGEMRRWLTIIGSDLEDESSDAKSKLEAAAKEGSALAMRIAGEAEARGLMQDKPDFVKAGEWWEKAAAAGDGPSLLLLARWREGGFAASPNEDRAGALDYYRKALEAGEDDALIPMARLLLSTHEAEARDLLDRAMAKGISSAWLVLADLERGKGNEVLALESYGKGAAMGDTACMRKLAEQLLAENKRGEGLEWLEKAAAAGDPEAAGDLGGLLSSSDPQGAAAYLLSAADAGVRRAQYGIAMLYLNGKLGRPDPHSAVAWLTEAMNSGDAEMQYKLATLHEQGLGCPINYANAGVLYTMACNKGHAAAPGRIAFMATEGLGTRVDPVQAYAYASLAVERGDQSSKPLLAKLSSMLTPAEKEESSESLKKLRGAPGGAVGAAAEAGKPAAGSPSPAK